MEDSHDSCFYICGGSRIDLFLAEIPCPACREAETFRGGTAGQGHEEASGRSGEFLWKHPEGAARDEESYGEYQRTGRSRGVWGDRRLCTADG